jgi:hypothetical protein
MQIDHAAEWQRLTNLYREMWDDELLNLAEDFPALTELAQQVLRDELKKRGLGDARPPDGVPAQSGPRDSSQGIVPPSQWETPLNLPQAEDAAEETALLHEYTWKTLLCECDTREEAWQIYEVLRRAHIESWIEAPGSRSVELSSPRVLVAADELDKAREITAQPIPQDIIEESKMKLPEFEPPTCPRCGAEDPVLESVEPCNSWACESCGNEWTESA